MDSGSLVVAVAAVIVRDGRALASRRSLHRDVAPGLWEVCSGRVEAGEQPRAAIEREIAEETSLQVRIDDRPLDAYIAARGSGTMLLIAYRADWVAGEPQLSAEHDEHVWWTLSEFESGAVPPEIIAAVRYALTRPAGGGSARG